MDYTPPGHVGRHHHHRRNDDDEEYPPPPPPHMTHSPYPPPPMGPTYGGGSYPPPPEHNYPPPPSYGGSYDQPPPAYGGVYEQPPPSYHSSHSHTPNMEYQNYPPQQPPPPSFSHHSENEESEGAHHHFRPHMPGFIEGHFHHGSTHETHGSDEYDGGRTGLGPELDFLANKPSYRIISKAGGDQYYVAIRDGKLVLTHPNSSDRTQYWYKDERYSTKVKDAEGYPSFALVNKATGQAVKHSVSALPVHLVHYKPDVFDESILWTQSKDLGSGFRTIRMVNNIHLVMDAFNGDQKHGGVHDGTYIALYECWKGDNQNQQWKIIPY